MPYCAPEDVAALNKARVLGQGNNPTVEDVQVYINMAAAEIDSILVNKGYSVPIDPSYQPAYNLLNSLNAKGAVAIMERSAPTSVNLDRWEKEWDAAKKDLIASDQVMDAPKDVQRAEPRGPGVTTAPGVVAGDVINPGLPFRRPWDNQPGTPMFSRTMTF